MSCKSNPATRCASCQELETALSIWIAANDAKSERLEELEAECAQLRAQVARLARIARRDKSAPVLRRATNAR